jgi:hypothetical protein
MERSTTTTTEQQQQQQQGRRRGAGWRRWAVLVATVWIQAVTGTNFDFSAYSSALKASLGVSQEALNYLATASDLGKALGWSSGLALIHLPLPAVLLLSAASGLAAYALQYALILDYLHLPYPLVRTHFVFSLSLFFSFLYYRSPIRFVLIKLDYSISFLVTSTYKVSFHHDYIQEI